MKAVTLKPPYSLTMLTFGAAFAIGVVALLASSWVLFVAAFAPVVFIVKAQSLVDAREQEDRLALYRPRPVVPVNRVASLAAGTAVALLILAGVMVWAQQTPHGDAVAARQRCAGQLVAGAETAC